MLKVGRLKDPDREGLDGRDNAVLQTATYIWTAEGWLYVSEVIDLFSRCVVGWSMSAGMTAQLVANALLVAIWRRGKPDMSARLGSNRRWD